MEHATNSQVYPTGAQEAIWDQSQLSDLLHVDNVWAVIVTNGTGESVYLHERRDIPAQCPERLDLAAGVIRHCGEHLNTGQLNFMVFMYSGALVVGTHSDSGASAFALAAPEANLGQLLAHIRKVRLGAFTSSGGQP